MKKKKTELLFFYGDGGGVRRKGVEQVKRQQHANFIWDVFLFLFLLLITNEHTGCGLGLMLYRRFTQILTQYKAIPRTEQERSLGQIGSYNFLRRWHAL